MPRAGAAGASRSAGVRTRRGPGGLAGVPPARTAGGMPHVRVTVRTPPAPRAAMSGITPGPRPERATAARLRTSRAACGGTRPVRTVAPPGRMTDAAASGTVLPARRDAAAPASHGRTATRRRAGRRATRATPVEARTRNATARRTAVRRIGAPATRAVPTPPVLNGHARIRRHAAGRARRAPSPGVPGRAATVGTVPSGTSASGRAPDGPAWSRDGRAKGRRAADRDAATSRGAVRRSTATRRDATTSDRPTSRPTVPERARRAARSARPRAPHRRPVRRTP